MSSKNWQTARLALVCADSDLSSAPGWRGPSIAGVAREPDDQTRSQLRAIATQGVISTGGG